MDQRIHLLKFKILTPTSFLNPGLGKSEPSSCGIVVLTQAQVGSFVDAIVIGRLF